MFGSAGMAEAGNEFPNTARMSGANSIRRDLPLNFFMDRYVEAYLQEMREFVRCVAEDTDPPVTGTDGKIPVLMGLAAGRSLREKRPIQVPAGE